jgi:hypothetical protein
MTRRAVLVSCTVLVLLLPALGQSQNKGTPPSTQAPPAGERPPSPDSLAALNDSLANEVLAAIRGRENAPAESVFQNIKALKGVPAGRVPRIMAMGFSRSLGAGCFDCHTKDKKWESDANKHKEVARIMWTMTQAINSEHLTKHPELEGSSVNCWTCHRGHKDPAWEMKQRGAGGASGR